MDKLKEITPKNFKCGIGPCPAIFESGNCYIIIGKVADNDIQKELDDRIGAGEVAIEVPKGLLSLS